MSDPTQQAFNFKPRARRGSPETSRIAARKIDLSKCEQARNLILGILTLDGPHTDEQLYEKLSRVVKISPSGARSRRAELCDAELVEDSKVRGRTVLGNPCVVWRRVQR